MRNMKIKGKTNPLKPSVQLLSKLGSVVVHVDEMLHSKGHRFDGYALQQLLVDTEVLEWLKQMGPLVPVKRGET